MKKQTRSASKIKKAKTSKRKSAQLATAAHLRNMSFRLLADMKPIYKSTLSAIRQAYRFTNRYGLAFYGLAITWGLVAILSINTIKQSHAALPSNGVRDNLITTNTISPQLSFWIDIVELLIIVLIVALFVTAIIAIRKNAWRKLIGTVNLGVIILGLVFIQAASMYHNDTAMAVTYSVKTPQSLSRIIVERAMCGAAVRTLGSYSYGAKHFYELKDKGYHLAATYNSPNGGLDSTKACRLYYSIRDKYPADHIILQLYTVDSHGKILPYTYSDIGHSLNGIFVKD